VFSGQNITPVAPCRMGAEMNGARRWVSEAEARCTPWRQIVGSEYMYGCVFEYKDTDPPEFRS
jgi:hypothetical protein